MDFTALLESARGITTVLSLLAFLGALFFWFVQNNRKQSLFEAIRGEDVTHPDAVAKILTTYNNDDQRLKALAELLKVDKLKSRALLDKIKGRVDFSRFWTRQQTTFIVTLVILGLLFGALAAFGFLAGQNKNDPGTATKGSAQPEPPQPITPDSLDIADVSFLDYEGDARAPRLDLKLTNMGSRPAYVKRVRLHVKESWKLRALPVLPGIVVPPSHEYVLTLKSSEKAPFEQAIEVSHGLKHDEFDRFTIQLEEDPWPESNTIYHANMKLLVNSNDVSYQTPDLLFLITQKQPLLASAEEMDEIVRGQESLGREVNRAEMREAVASNRALLLKVAKINATRSQTLAQLIKAAKKAD